MKTNLIIKIVFIVFILVSIIGCPVYQNNPMIDFKYDGNTNFTNLKQLTYAVNIYMTYKKDGCGVKNNHAQSPQESIDKKCGDCEDFVILFLGLAKKYLNSEATMYLIKIKGDKDYHMVIIKDGIVYDPTRNIVYKDNPKVYAKITFWEINYLLQWNTFNYHLAYLITKTNNNL